MGRSMFRRFTAARLSGLRVTDFLNLVARLRSEETPKQICEEIERLHELSGRVRGGEKWASRPLDIDLLLYDDLVMDKPPVRVPRSDILEYSFVLRPLAELAPDLVHPVTGKTMLQHWQEFDEDSHPLELVGLFIYGYEYAKTDWSLSDSAPRWLWQ